MRCETRGVWVHAVTRIARFFFFYLFNAPLDWLGLKSLTLLELLGAQSCFGDKLLII